VPGAIDIAGFGILYQYGIPAYAYSTEIPVAVLGAEYEWARGAGFLLSGEPP
jgi:hypothetical protein